MTANAIEAVGLSKKFLMATERRTSLKERFVRGASPEPQTFWALKDASFVVPKGSSLGIIGQNGSGKSTALKVLVGIYRPTAGTVKVNGSVSALLEVGAGFHPELTGRENIRLNATILGFTNREIDRLMDQIIEFADIGDHIDGPLKHYSSGMGVRLGFAVAVMVRPQILIVDEVIAVGDEEFQRKCYDYLHGLRRAGTSMIIVSHGLGQITDLCDDAVWLDAGCVRNSGPARRVVRAYLESVNDREAQRLGQSTGVVEPPPEMAPPQTETPVPADDPPDLPGDETPHDRQDEIAEPASVDGLRRRGAGEVRVTALEYLDAEGVAAGILIAGRDCTIRIHFQAGEEVQGPVFGLGFDNHDMVIGGVNNSHLEPWTLSPGAGHVDFHASPLLLAAGTYRVRTQVHVGSHVMDAVDSGFLLKVRAPDVEMDGTYLQPGEWFLGDHLAVARQDI